MRGGIGEILVILLIIAVVLLITGGKRIPEIAKSLREGKDILTEDDKEDTGKTIAKTDSSKESAKPDNGKAES